MGLSLNAFLTCQAAINIVLLLVLYLARHRKVRLNCPLCDLEKLSIPITLQRQAPAASEEKMKKLLLDVVSDLERPEQGPLRPWKTDLLKRARESLGMDRSTESLL